VSPHRDIKPVADFPDSVGPIVIDDVWFGLAVVPFECVFVDGVVEVLAEDLQKHFSISFRHSVLTFFGETIRQGGAEEKLVTDLLDFDIGAGFAFYYYIAHPDFGNAGVYGGGSYFFRDIILRETERCEEYNET
jgi:hypothetical protein